MIRKTLTILSLLGLLLSVAAWGGELSQHLVFWRQVQLSNRVRWREVCPLAGGG